MYIWMQNHVSGHVLRPADPSDRRMPSPYGGPQRGLKRAGGFLFRDIIG